MRQHTEEELTKYLSYQAKNYAVAVITTDYNGVRTNLSFLEGRDYIKSISIDESQDAPSMECQVTVQRRFDATEVSPPPAINWSSAHGPLSLDNRLEVWSKLEGFDSLLIFDGRINENDAGGDEVKIVARDVCHDLTQAFIAPGMIAPEPATMEPPPGGAEVYEAS